MKNARLCRIFEGQELTHRELVLDSEDVERFLATVVPLMRPGRDLVWISLGRVDSNLGKLNRILAAGGGKESPIETKLLHEVFYFCKKKNAKRGRTGGDPLLLGDGKARARQRRVESVGTRDLIERRHPSRGNEAGPA